MNQENFKNTKCSSYYVFLLENHQDFLKEKIRTNDKNAVLGEQTDCWLRPDLFFDKSKNNNGLVGTRKIDFEDVVGLDEAKK